MGVNGQACCIALTHFVPLSRGAGAGEHAAGRTAVRPYTPRPQRGRGAGDEGYKNAHTPARSELKRCTLIRSLSHPVGEGTPCADRFGVLKRQLQRWAEASLPHATSGVEPLQPRSALTPARTAPMIASPASGPLNEMVAS